MDMEKIEFNPSKVDNIPVGGIPSPPGGDIRRVPIAGLGDSPLLLFNTIQLLTEMINSKDERIKQLTDLLLAKEGITEQKVILPQSPSGPMQEATSPAARWEKVKRRLEHKYRKVPEQEEEYDKELEKANTELEAMEVGNKV